MFYLSFVNLSIFLLSFYLYHIRKTLQNSHVHQKSDDDNNCETKEEDEIDRKLSGEVQEDVVVWVKMTTLLTQLLLHTYLCCILFLCYVNDLRSIH